MNASVNPSQDELYMRAALQEAKIAADEGNWPIGCVIVLRDQIITRTHNTSYTDHNALAHAEIKALQSVWHLLDTHRHEAILYTTYEPCPMCLGAIVLSKLQRIVTGVNLDGSGCLELVSCLPIQFQQPKFQFEVTRNVLEAECAEVFVNSLRGKDHMEQNRAIIDQFKKYATLKK